MSAATLIDLPRLVDLALGTPDSGAVNFNVLHALLHSIVHLLNVGNVRIELSDIPICKPEPPATAIKAGAKITIVEEYKLEGGKKVPVKKSLRDVEKVIRVQKTGKESAITEIPIPSTTIKEPENPKASTGMEKQQKSGKQQDVVSQGQPHGPGVVNMEEILNIAKRMDQSDNRTNSMEKTLKDLWNKYENLNKAIQEMSKGLKGGEFDINEMERRDELTKSKGQDQEHKDTAAGKARKAGKDDELYTEEGNRSQQQFYDNKQITAIEEEVRNIKSEIDEIKKKLQINDKEDEKGNEKSSSKSKDDSECLSSVEMSVEKECNYLIKKLNHKFDLLSEKSLTVNDRILDIEKDLCELHDQLESLMVSKNGRTSQLTIIDLVNDINDVKKYATESIKNIQVKVAEHIEFNSKINNLGDAIKKLTISKIDKDDFEELLSEKVDYNMLQRKVSVDQFDATKRDLESFMVNTLRKIEERDNDWCKTIALFKKELELKLNAVEITALRQYFEKRFQAMNDNLLALHSERKDPEAAGTRSKMLRDLCCISCNRCVLMRPQEENKVPQLKPMSVRKSIKPFLTYELDNIRKQMRMPGKNLRHLEAIFKDNNIVDSTAKQICNRYCGGSHTIITAEDRIKRGRSGKLYGTEGTKPPKCKCLEPEPPVCTCPDEEEGTEICPCPVETEICECPSDDDHLEKCASARRKRCAEIDRQRHQICKEEFERKRQIESCRDDEGSNEKRHYRSCKDPRRRRRPCVYETDTDVGEQCQAQLEQYQKCIDATHYDTYSTNIKRESIIESFSDKKSIRLFSTQKDSGNYDKSIDKKELKQQEEFVEDMKLNEIDEAVTKENIVNIPAEGAGDVVGDQDVVKGQDEYPIYDEEEMEEEQEEY